MKRLLELLKSPKDFVKMLYLNILMTIYKISGKKTIVYNLHQDYFYDIFETVYTELKSNPKITFYFSYLDKDEHLYHYLRKNIAHKFLISSNISPFVNFDIFICPEITGPDFPFKYFNTKKIEIYHGTGTYNLYEKNDVLNRFDTHFAIGPRFNDFLKFAYKNKKIKPKIYNIGYPKLDLLLKKNQLSEKLKTYYQLANKKTILYAPHWNQYGSLHYFQEKLLENLAEMDINILVKPHNYLYTEYAKDNWKDRLNTIANKHGNITFIQRPNTQELFPLADILVTDTGTTTALEFGILEKPTLIFCNEKWFENNDNNEIERDLCDLAICYHTIEELKKKIIEIIENGNSEELEKQKTEQKKIVEKYLYQPGEATSKAISAIYNELGMKKRKREK